MLPVDSVVTVTNVTPASTSLRQQRARTYQRVAIKLAHGGRFARKVKGLPHAIAGQHVESSLLMVAHYAHRSRVLQPRELLVKLPQQRLPAVHSIERDFRRRRKDRRGRHAAPITG